MHQVRGHLPAVILLALLFPDTRRRLRRIRENQRESRPEKMLIAHDPLIAFYPPPLSRHDSAGCKICGDLVKIGQVFCKECRQVFCECETCLEEDKREFLITE